MSRHAKQGSGREGEEGGGKRKREEETDKQIEMQRHTETHRDT